MRSTTLLILILILSLLMTACATTRPSLDRQAIEDFIKVRQLQAVDSIRTESGDSFTDLNDWYLHYKTRRGDFLVRFGRTCWELRDNVVVADKRWESARLRARFDTIRGCRIAEIFALSEADVLELEQLGEAPGSRE